ncbi:MAG: hypothetical protein KDB07_08615, partial [Planctomycetes bacterium]|nr:hypothetical protein [Planctomycetota bacterium]
RDFIIDVMRRKALADSRRKLTSIQQMVELYRMTENAYPATLEVLVQNDWMSAEDLKDALDKREGATNSFDYIKPSNDAIKTQRLVLAAQAEAFVGKTRLVILLNGEFREMTDEEYKVAKEMTAKGEELPALEPEMPEEHPVREGAPREAKSEVWKTEDKR